MAKKTWRDCKQHMENSTKYPHIPGQAGKERPTKNTKKQPKKRNKWGKKHPKKQKNHGGTVKDMYSASLIRKGL